MSRTRSALLRWIPPAAVLVAAVLAVAAAPRPAPESPLETPQKALEVATPVAVVVAPATVESDRDRGCLSGVPGVETLGSLPGELSEARSLQRTRDRVVEADNRTTLHVIALATTLEEDVDFVDILSFREHRTEVCVFDRLSSLEADTVLGSLALGVDFSPWALRKLVPDRHVVVAFDSVVNQTVKLDGDVAVAALAAHKAGFEVRLEDVLTVHQDVRTRRTFESTTDLERDDAILALVASGGG